jgi:hypothetical protein
MRRGWTGGMGKREECRGSVTWRGHGSMSWRGGSEIRTRRRAGLKFGNGIGTEFASGTAIRIWALLHKGRAIIYHINLHPLKKSFKFTDS